MQKHKHISIYGQPVRVLGGPAPYELVPLALEGGIDWQPPRVDETALRGELRALVQQRRVVPSPPTVRFSKVTHDGAIIPGSWRHEPAGVAAAVSSIGTGEPEYQVVCELVFMADSEDLQEVEAGVELLNELAEEGSWHAHAELLFIDLDDSDMSRSTKASLRALLRRADISPFLKAHIQPVLFGEEAPTNVKARQKWLDALMESAALGASWAMLALGKHYQTHQSVGDNRERARAMFIEATRRGDLAALAELGGLIQDDQLAHCCRTTASLLSYLKQQAGAIPAAWTE